MIKNINPDVLIVGEVWEDASVKVSYGTLRPYLTGNQLDSVMNYPFREAVIRYLSGGVTEKFIESVMMNVMFDIPSRSDVAKCIVTDEVIESSAEPMLILNDKKEKKTKEETA